jgi:hypothetical protein
MLIPNDDVKEACQSQGSYWFGLALDANTRSVHGGKPLYVHGISPWGGPNLAINRSGTFTVPTISRTAELVQASAGPEHIFNGETSTLTFQFRNTGNVVWNPGDTYLALTTLRTSQSVGLNSAVAPGAVATFTINVSPVNSGSGVAQFQYFGQLASGATVWGPKGQVTIRAENHTGSCNLIFCEQPR